jgi:hypothetical protein
MFNVKMFAEMMEGSEQMMQLKLESWPYIHNSICRVQNCRIHFVWHNEGHTGFQITMEMEKVAQWGASWFVLIRSIIRQISRGGWGGRGMWHAWVRRGKCVRVWWESPKEWHLVEDRGVNGRMWSEWILGRLAGGGVECNQLAQDRGRWWAVVNAVMNLRVLAPRS